MMNNHASKSSQSGMTLLEVMVALVIVSTTALPLLISLGDAHRRVTRTNIKRQMKQLMEYKLAHILLDRPAEDQEPIYVDGAEGNFGEDFEAMDSDEKRYFFDDSLYNYSYRIDSQEIDLGSAGGITGEEIDDAEDEPGERNPAGAPGLGIGAAGGEDQEEEELGQLRYIVTLTVFFRSGNANFDQAMSVVTYVKHPHESEAMSGPDLGPGGAASGLGSGEAGVGRNTTDPTRQNPRPGQGGQNIIGAPDVRRR